MFGKRDKVETWRRKGKVVKIIRALEHSLAIDGELRLGRPSELDRGSLIRALADIGGEEAVAVLAKTLSAAMSRDYDSDFDVYAPAVARALGKTRSPKAVDSLLVAVAHGDHSTKRAAIVALGELGDGRAVETLLFAQQDQSYRTEATESLKKLGKLNIDPFVRAMENQSEPLRLAAAKALGEMGSIVAVEPLVEALAGSSMNVRRAAAKALARLGWTPKGQEDGQAIRYLMAAGEFNACAAYGEKALDPLIEAISQVEEPCRKQIAEVLGHIGPCAIPPLVNALARGDLHVGETVVEALSKIDDERAVRLLAQILGRNESETLGLAAAKALGDSGSKLAMEPLVEALAASSMNVRRAAAKALARLGWTPKGKEDGQALRYLIAAGEFNACAAYCEKAVDPLIEAISQVEEPCRKQIAEVLAHTGPCAIPSLVSALERGNLDFKKTIVTALEIQKWEPARGRAAALFYILTDQFSRLDNVRDDAIELLTQELECSQLGVGGGFASSLLISIGGLRAADAVLQYLFRTPRSMMRDSLAIFGEYADLVRSASGYEDMGFEQESDPWGHWAGHYRVSTAEGDRAVLKLCELKTPISTNLLHLIAKKKDLEYCSGRSDDHFFTSTLSFDYQRRKALEELERRGNPAYNPLAYLDKAAWEY